jgi:hypothetical protein
METQIHYSNLLHGSNLGIALENPRDDIDVGDLCAWDDGKAVRVLNIFENQEVRLSHAAVAINGLMCLVGSG